MNGDELRHTIQDLIGLAVPVLISVAITSTIVLYVIRWMGSRVSKPNSLFPIAFALLGGICGVIAGASSEPLVGGLITGVLGLVSALMSYAFTREPDGDVRAALPAIVMLLLVNALIGLSVGQNWKRKWDNYEKELAEYRTEYNEIWVPITKEYQLQVMRRCIARYQKYEDVQKHCNYTSLFATEQ